MGRVIQAPASPRHASYLASPVAIDLAATRLPEVAFCGTTPLTRQHIVRFESGGVKAESAAGMVASANEGAQAFATADEAEHWLWESAGSEREITWASNVRGRARRLDDGTFVYPQRAL